MAKTAVLSCGYKCTGSGKAVWWHWNYDKATLYYTTLAEGKRRQKKMPKEKIETFITNLLNEKTNISPRQVLQ